MAAPTKSTAITNLDAALLVKSNVNLDGARVRVKRQMNHTIPFTDSAIADVHRMLRINSSDRLLALYLFSDGGATAGDADVGLYLARDGAVVDADCFVGGTAWALDTATAEHAAAAALLNQLYEADVFNETNSHLPVWNVATALTADPFVQYDIALTMTVAATVADTVVGMELWYTAGD